MSAWQSITKKWKSSPVVWLLILFSAINVLCHHDAGGNPFSRVATMASISENFSYQIDDFAQWTDDWAKGPNGHYYSNKAPGPMILGAPFYAPWDRWLTRGIEDKGLRSRKRADEQRWGSYIVSIFLQLIPTLLIVLWAVKFLSTNGFGARSQMLFVVAYLFANTLSLKMNTYFGHAFSGWLALATLLSWLEKRWYLAGLFAGLSLLCDYSGLFVIISFFSLAFAFSDLNLKACWKILLGALAPAFLWCHYHIHAFGSPFKIANHFQNPAHVDMKKESDNLMGVIGLFPRWNFLRNILWGSSRGLLQTQGWLLFYVIASSLCLMRGRIKDKISLRVLSFALVNFFLLLYMNGSFGGWHGGATIGPRYLSWSFSLIAFSLPFCWQSLPSWSRKCIGVGIFVSLIFYVLAMSTLISPPLVPIWEMLIEWTFIKPFRSYTQTRFVILSLALVWASLEYRKRYKKGNW